MNPWGRRRIIILPGQYYDSETGLHYNWHRFYDPSTGRYISADPIGLQGGMNLYSYVNQNPINMIDPWGLEWIDITAPLSPWATRKGHYYVREKNNQVVIHKDAITQKWNGDVPARYHQHGPYGKYYRKYVSPDGHSENVYDMRNFALVNDPANIGMYNFADPQKDPIAHFLWDMLPYYFWGNSPDDNTPLRNRILGPDGNIVCEPDYTIGI